MNCKYCKLSLEETPKCEKLNDDCCPHVYFCDKKQTWKELNSMYTCSVKNRRDGNVQMERHGYLYVEVDSQVIKVKNPYNYIPENVKIIKTNNGYKIKGEK